MPASTTFNAKYASRISGVFSISHATAEAATATRVSFYPNYTHFISFLAYLRPPPTWWKRIYKNLKQRQINFVKSQCDQFQLKKFIWFTMIASKFLLITPPSSINRNDIETDLSRCWRGYRYDKAYMHTHSTYKKD